MTFWTVTPSDVQRVLNERLGYGADIGEAEVLFNEVIDSSLLDAATRNADDEIECYEYGYEELERQLRMYLVIGNFEWPVVFTKDLDCAQRYTALLEGVVLEGAKDLWGEEFNNKVSISLQSHGEEHAVVLKTENINMCHGTRRLADWLRGWLRGQDSRKRSC